MANITNLVSYDLNGVKESFANWISNISPTDTPFVSMTGKEAINNKYFQWQEDSLGKVDQYNAQQEGSSAGDAAQLATRVQKNVTQILRKVVQVSDTADSLASYGRGSELAYQMEKAGAEIKRDLEWAFLHNGASVDGSAVSTAHPAPFPGGATLTGVTGQNNGIGGTNGPAPAGITSGHTLQYARQTAGFKGLVAGESEASPDAVNTSAVYVNLKSGTANDFDEDDLFKLTTALYEAGANPSVIMFHPSYASKFSALMETGRSTTGASRVRMFDGADDTKINTYVSSLVDPLGQEFKLIPNRFMPSDAIYVFDPSDWTQMVLRAPQRTKLAKTGSFEKWMIEMEVGLRHRNKFASGILNLTA